MKDSEDKSQISDGYHTFGELYEHRHKLFLMLMATLPEKAWISRLYNDGSSVSGWFVAGIHLISGDITYHLPDRLWWLGKKTCAKVLDKAPPWDGHTSGDVLIRLETAILDGDCPNCPNVGYYSVPDENGEEEQVPCGWCHVTSYSKFNRLTSAPPTSTIPTP